MTRGWELHHHGREQQHSFLLLPSESPIPPQRIELPRHVSVHARWGSNCAAIMGQRSHKSTAQMIDNWGDGATGTMSPPEAIDIFKYHIGCLFISSPTYRLGIAPYHPITPPSTHCFCHSVLNRHSWAQIHHAREVDPQLGVIFQAYGQSDFYCFPPTTTSSIGVRPVVQNGPNSTFATPARTATPRGAA